MTPQSSLSVSQSVSLSPRLQIRAAPAQQCRIASEVFRSVWFHLPSASFFKILHATANPHSLSHTLTHPHSSSLINNTMISATNFWRHTSNVMSPQAAALRETSNPPGLVCHVQRRYSDKLTDLYIQTYITVGEEAVSVSGAVKHVLVMSRRKCRNTKLFQVNYWERAREQHVSV